jgi:hypothetical protein
MTDPHPSLYNSVRIVTTIHVRTDWILVRIPASRGAVGTTQSPIQWGPKNPQFYAVPRTRTRGALPPLLGSILPLRIRLLCVVLNLVFGTSFPFFTLTFLLRCFWKRTAWRGLRAPKFFHHFQYRFIHTYIHTYIYVHIIFIIMSQISFLQDCCFWDVTPCRLV